MHLYISAENTFTAVKIKVTFGIPQLTKQVGGIKQGSVTAENDSAKIQ